MQIETYPIPNHTGRTLTFADEYVYEKAKKSSHSFICIGNKNQAEQYFPAHFQDGVFATDFVQAKLALIGMLKAGQRLPDTVFIDVPVNLLAIQQFSNFLKEENLNSRIVMVYNQRHLDRMNIKMLKRFELIDDVMDLNSWHVDFGNKITFLHRVKHHQRLHVTAEMQAPAYGRQSRAGAIAKRAIDIILASLFLLAALPFLLIIAIAIKIDSRGPVFYNSLRAGKGFRIFKFFKFRTMEVDADSKIEELAHLNQYEDSHSGVKFLKICNDPRVTSFGKILRKTSLDELPQLFNVLKGDMSIVGNRPLPIYEATTLTTNDFVERFMAPAGITGLWQIKKKGKPNMTVEERVSLDICYARNHSVLYDLWIISKTPGALFQKVHI